MYEIMKTLHVYCAFSSGLVARFFRFLAIIVCFVIPGLGSDQDAQPGRPVTFDVVATVGNLQVFEATQDGWDSDCRWSIQIDVATKHNKKQYVKLLKEELGIYSPKLLGRCGLRSIVICGKISVNGKGLPGFSIPDNGRIFFEIVDPSRLQAYIRRGVHHELFHLIEFKNNMLGRDDPAWSKLNPESFKYGKGGYNERDPSSSLPDETTLGFINRYSRSAIEEDKAVIYSYMMSDRKILDGMIAKDGILSSKTKEIEKMLYRFSKEFDESFWLRARGLSRD
jgi:hypothetical protein